MVILGWIIVVQPDVVRVFQHYQVNLFFHQKTHPKMVGSYPRLAGGLGEAWALRGASEQFWTHQGAPVLDIIWAAHIIFISCLVPKLNMTPGTSLLRANFVLLRKILSKCQRWFFIVKLCSVTVDSQCKNQLWCMVPLPPGLFGHWPLAFTRGTSKTDATKMTTRKKSNVISLVLFILFKTSTALNKNMRWMELSCKHSIHNFLCFGPGIALLKRWWFQLAKVHSIASGLASIIAAANLGWWGASMMCVTGWQKRSFAQLSVTTFFRTCWKLLETLETVGSFFLATYHGRCVE